MNMLYARLTSLRVADIMNPSVVVVERSLGLEEAAQRLRSRDITSAPVVDEQGRCVGMLSAVDFIVRDRTTAAATPLADEHVVAHARGTPISIDRVESSVGDFMSSAVQSIASGASLLDAARIMVASHLHRLPVLDQQGHPIGVVSSLDLVSALMNAMDEHREAIERGK